MKSFLQKLGPLVTLLCIIVFAARADLLVSPTNSASALLQALFGSSINIVGTPTYVGANDAASGSFTGGNSANVNLGIESGLLLTNGYAVNAIGPNDSGDKSGPGTTSTLSFSFSNSVSSDLSFSYVFASEEYPESAFPFNDTFKLFVDGVNIAFIPGTSKPVTTVGAVAAGSFISNPSGASGLQYDGVTPVFIAEVPDLAPGIHEVILIIEDGGDENVDSAIFGTGQNTEKPTNAVPEGGTTVGLFGAAVLALGLLKRRNA